MLNIKKYFNEPLYHNSIAIILNGVVGSIFGLLFWIVAAKTMTSKDIGLATAVISVTTFIYSLSKFGMDSGIIRYLPIYKNKDDFYSSVTIITLIASIILSIIFILGLDIFSPSLSFIKEGYILIIWIVLIMLMSFNNIQYNTLVSLRKGSLSFIYNLLLGLRIPILFFVANLGIIGIFSAYEIAYFLTFIFGIYVVSRQGIKFKFKLNMEPIKESFFFSIGNYTAGIFSVIATTIIPILIVNMIGAENCAYYYVAYSVASILFLIPTATSMSLFVEGSHDFPLKENVLKTLNFTLLLLMPLIIIFLLFGDKILLLFNSEFSEQSFELLKLLVISSFFSMIISIYITIKKVQKDVKIINIINIMFTIILLILVYFFILGYGLMGVGYAWIVSNIIISMLILYLITKKEKWSKIISLKNLKLSLILR